MNWNRLVPVLIASLFALQFLSGALHAGENKEHQKMYVNDEIKEFWKKHWYFGNMSTEPDPSKRYCGAWVDLDYSGQGEFPAPAIVTIPLKETFPIGKVYQVFLRNMYAAKVEITVGDITRLLDVKKANMDNWTKLGVFEPNAPFDKITLAFHPTKLIKNNGEKQNERHFVMGFYVGTEPLKMPRKAGEVVIQLPQDAPVALKGNYLENASFEAGLCSWGKLLGTTYIFTADNLDDTTAADGRYSLKMSREQAMKTSGSQFTGFALETKLIRLPPDRRYTVSFYAKSNKPAVVKLQVDGLRDDARQYGIVPKSATDFTSGTDWKRHSVTVLVPAMTGNLYTLRFRVDLKEASEVWLDAVQLEEADAATEFKSRERLQAGCISRTPGNIFYNDVPGTAEILISNPNALKEAVLKYTIVNYWGNEVDKGERLLKLDGKKSDTFSLPLFTRQNGIYRLLLTAEDSISEMCYSVLPPNPFLGKKNPGGTLGGEAVFGPYHLSVLKRANFSWVMSKSLARWALVEPEQGRYKFDDAAIQAADSNHLSVLLQPFPGIEYQVQKSWFKDLVKPDKTKAMPWAEDKKAEYLRLWREYVRNLVSHFKDSVKYWEIDNEPNWEHTAPEYAQILKAAIEGAKEADADAKIVGFSGGGYNDDFYNSVAAATDMTGVDCVSVHFYGNNDRDMKTFAKFRQKFDNKPGWNTETGRSCPSFLSTLVRYDQFVLPDYWREVQEAIVERSVATAKNYLMSISLAGCERYFYYTTRFNNSGPSEPTWKMAAMDLMEYDGGLRPSGVALSIASHFMDGSKYHGPVEGHPDVETYIFRKGEGSVGVLWAKPGLSAKLNRPDAKSVAFFDIMGNPVKDGALEIDDSPVYFTSKDAVEKVEALLKTMK